VAQVQQKVVMGEFGVGHESALHRSMVTFVSNVVAEQERRRPYHEQLIHKCERAVRALWPRAVVKAYGSCVTGLCLPTSDLDLVICLPKVHRDAPAESPGDLEGRNAIRQTWQQEFARKLSDESLSGWNTHTSSSGNKGWVVRESINLIVQTAVPIITLVATPRPLTRGAAATAAAAAVAARAGIGAQYGDDGSSSEHKAEIDDMPPPIRLDISFEGPNHHGLATNGLVTSLVKEHPALRALVLILKQFLYERGFDQAYTGGLSSYGLVLMVARFLQSHKHAYEHEHRTRGAGAAGAGAGEVGEEEEQNHKHKHKRSSSGGSVGSNIGGAHDDNWGRLLRRFLHFYGCEFEPRSTGISVRSWSYPHRTGMAMSGPAGAYASSSFDTLHIEDPLNIHNNVGRNCFRIAQIQRAFADAFAALTSTSIPTAIGSPGAATSAIGGADDSTPTQAMSGKADSASAGSGSQTTSTAGDSVGRVASSTSSSSKDVGGASGADEHQSFMQCSDLRQMLQNSEGRSTQHTVESVMHGHNHHDNNAQHVLVGGDAV
jgi:hypothetical protein